MCELERSSFQKKVSIHNQDFSRFPLTIYENIKLDEIDELEKESIHRFLSENSFLIQEDLYDKLDVTLGNQYLYSKQISGGQWQRIALSRAFYKNSDLLIIDEGTAEIDPFTQREIFEYLGKIKREKIIIYVTHDLKLASLADKIFVFKNGMIIEEGPHHELIQKNGEYSKMWGIMMKVDFSNLFNNPKNKSNETELTLIKQLIVSKELIFENFNIAIFLSVYCLRCIELLPELKKEEESLSKNGCVLIFDSSNEEMQNIITHFNLKIPTINTDLDFL